MGVRDEREKRGNDMTTMSKFLALIPVVAFAAGCNGTVPAGPSQVSNNDAIQKTSGDASATSLVKCTGLAAIELTVGPASSGSMLWVDATYHFSNPLPGLCAAPTWTSDRKELVVDKANHFRAGFNRTAGGTAILLATGPNGVQSRIQVDLNATRTVRGLPDACAVVATVSVKAIPATSLTNLLEASYTYNGPISTPCLTAPVWTADRRGLTVNPKNPFRASIDVSDTATTVTATAPNGIAGSTKF
jgi:hypothetical protein